MNKNITFFTVTDNNGNSDYAQNIPGKCEYIKNIYYISCNEINSSEGIRRISQKANTDLILIYTKPYPLKTGYKAIERMADYMKPENAGMAYADHYVMKGDTCSPHPVTDYQEGSVRDDFDFGSLIMFKTDIFRKAAETLSAQDEYSYSALYALRLAVSRISGITHIREFLYTEIENDLRKSGEKQFDYVDPRNRDVQIERERRLHII